jgi:hypothetical protein
MTDQSVIIKEQIDKNSVLSEVAAGSLDAETGAPFFRGPRLGSSASGK